MAILPDFGAATFVPGELIDNPYFPLLTGRVLSYQGAETDPDTGEVTIERNDLFTTSATFEVRGVETTVVRDTVYEDDMILEDTYDFYAQDSAGNVWYFGEIVLNYEYDDEGNFVGVNHEGEWSPDDPGNEPGLQMKATPEFGPAYYLEFAPGVAFDESILVETGLSVDTPFDHYDDVAKFIDSSVLSTGIEFKYYAPGVGEITELAVAPDGSTESRVDLYRTGQVGVSDPDDADDVVPALSGLREGVAVEDPAEIRDLDSAAFAGTGSTMHVTVIGGSTDSVDALGAYYIDAETGAISEARILVPDLSQVEPGASIAVEVPEGQTLGLFLVRGADEIGVDLEAYTEGGLHLENLLTAAPATMSALYAPTVTDDAGNILPIQPLSALGADDGTNLLNPAGSLQAIGVSSNAPRAEGIEIIGFEDRLNTSPEYDGDFNDAIVAVSEVPIDAATLRHLRSEAAGATLGTPGADRLSGTDGEDWLRGLAGNDQLSGGDGDDVLAGGRGEDRLEGGIGADTFWFSAGAPGEDRVADFDPDEGDVIALANFGSDFDALDTNDDGVIGAGDSGVERERGDLSLDLGGGVEIELADVTSLGADAFVFIA
jgi:hypothetical protein